MIGLTAKPDRLTSGKGKVAHPYLKIKLRTLYQNAPKLAIEGEEIV
jgi:hypothetical protein